MTGLPISPPLRLLKGLLLGLLTLAPQNVLALGPSDAETMFSAFNNAFLVRSGSDVFYKRALNNNNPDDSWTACLDIFGAEDAYERTGHSDKRQLVNDLMTTWVTKTTPPPWDWDGWNDDIGWFTMALVRAYQATGNSLFLDKAKDGFTFAYNRGWDTASNNGGIWEEQPADASKDGRKPAKEALSNDSLGKVACLIYQSTVDSNYLDKCKSIYQWSRSHLFDQQTGRVWTSVDPQGVIVKDAAVYNQGTFIDYATLVYLIAGDASARADAQLALNYLQTMTVNGIFSNTADYLSTWADDAGRATSHFADATQSWDKYYDWMVKNADSIMANRRTDRGITWNGWDQMTPVNDSMITNKFVSAVSWLYSTPAKKPSTIAGVHIIKNQQTGRVIDNGGYRKWGDPVVQWPQDNFVNLRQRWLFTPNADNSWNIISLDSWLTLENPSGNRKDKTPMDVWFGYRYTMQRWYVDQLADGSYKIWNQATGAALDGDNGGDGSSLVQSGWTGESHQRWSLLNV